MKATALWQRRVTITVCALAIGLSAACGSDDKSSSTGSDYASSAAAAASSVGSAAAGAVSSAESAVASATANLPGQDAVTITIKDFAYPGPLTVKAGGEITVVNEDTAEHSVTSDVDGKFSKDAEGGQTVTFTAPSEPGVYPYHCTYHPSMHGVLIVV